MTPSLRAQRIAGAAFLGLLGGAIAAVLILSGQSLGAGVSFEVELASPGPLRPGAHILLAGREIGEVRALRRLRPGPGGEQHVAAECFVTADHAADVHVNSDLFIATPSILGEAFLEVAPPREGHEPGPPVAAGQRLRGADPPDIDRLLQRVFASVTEGLALLRDHRPAFDELIASIDGLMATLSGIHTEEGQLARVRGRAAHAIDDAVALADAARSGDKAGRARRLAADLDQTVTDLRPELRALAEQADRAAERARVLASLVSPADADRAAAGFRKLAEVATRAERISADLQAIARRVERGEGAVGGFLHDEELWDDLHETHRLLKWKAWRLLKKTPPGTPTAPE